MKPASATEIKKELKSLDHQALVEIVQRLARYKKENKELLTYLLFEADDENGYVNSVKRQITADFAQVEAGHMYRATKSIRKILRNTNKFIKYSGVNTSAADLLIWFLEELNASGIRIGRSTALTNLYERQYEKIVQLVGKMHEDLQSDYSEALEQLRR